MRGPSSLRVPRMSWFDKLMPSRIRTEKRKHSVPEGLWVKCAGCSAQLYRAELNRNLHVCPKCSHHLRIGARERLELFLDAESGTSSPPISSRRIRCASKTANVIASA